MEPITLAFWIAFPVTLVLLGCALVTGLTRRRRLHLKLGPLALLSLLVAIVLAVEMGRMRVFPEAEMRIHKVIALIASSLAIAVAITGLWLIKNPRVRRLHKVCVLFFLCAAVVASGTGIWVFTLSTPR